jgi:hypothetical protein
VKQNSSSSMVVVFALLLLEWLDALVSSTEEGASTEGGNKNGPVGKSVGVLVILSYSRMNFVFLVSSNEISNRSIIVLNGQGKGKHGHFAIRRSKNGRANHICCWSNMRLGVAKMTTAL